MIDDPNAPATKADLEKVVEQMRDIETTLLREFRKAMLPIAARTKANTVIVNSFEERLAILQTEVDEIREGLK
jgi:hypothetical protein